ncbi:MAG: hypothetical protein HY342_03060 [Candidatus Lambdaproteobacteria bacterium]|nr:hypothetical protein [Candidatus Lambdaproteobacteria bacterium]
MKATPGPWHPYESGDPADAAGRHEIGVMDARQQVICRHFQHDPHAAANVHLVATAPELLEALERTYLAIADVLDNLPVEAGHLAHPLERAVNDIERVLFKAKRAEGR